MNMESYIMANRILDLETKRVVSLLEQRLDKIDNISQVNATATLEQLIAVVNKIISKDKRR